MSHVNKGPDLNFGPDSGIELWFGLQCVPTMEGNLQIQCLITPDIKHDVLIPAAVYRLV